MSVEATFFVNIVPGLESVAHLELCSRWGQAPDFFSLPPFPKVKSFKGGLEFQAPLSLGLELAPRLRTVTRMLLRLGQFEASHEKKMEVGLRQIPWGHYFQKKQKFDFRFTSKSSRLSMSRQIRMLLEKALKPHGVTYEKGGRKIFVRIFRDECELSMDCSGLAQFKRGDTQKGSIASLRASTASALLRLLFQGVEGPINFIDPMCGSGTSLLEAYHLDESLNREFSFTDFPGYKPLAQGDWKNSYQKDLIQNFYAFDLHSKAVSLTRKNLSQAFSKTDGSSETTGETLGLGNIIVDSADLFKSGEGLIDTGAGKNLVFVNPPWGQRLAGVSGDILQAIDKKYKPHRIGFLMPAHWKLGSISLEKVRDIPFENSGVANRFLIFA